MAGYIMTIGAEEYLHLYYAKTKKGKPRKNNIAKTENEGRSLAKQKAMEECILSGTYSTSVREGSGPFVGVLADYLGMRPGDDIYFFYERTIYGIGKLVKLNGMDCIFSNYYDGVQQDDKDLVNYFNKDSHRLICVFKPSPLFFRKGVDMDEVLNSAPDKIKMLRFFSKRSFIQLDDIENMALKSIIIRKNEACLYGFNNKDHFEYDINIHNSIIDKINTEYEHYRLNPLDFFKYKNSTRKELSSEYYLEGAILNASRENNLVSFGNLSFLSRQYTASPPKPTEYMESMDLFGYRYVNGYEGIISKYVVIELKTGELVDDHIRQTMKYVDWIAKEYTNGDYSMIEAYTIGYSTQNVQNIDEIIKRIYTSPGRNVTNFVWDNLKVISYLDILKEIVQYNNETSTTEN